MNCPTDNTTLIMSDRQGIEIDYCPTCRGVWLDRGELDKIIERSASHHQSAPSQHIQYDQQAPAQKESYDARKTPHHYHKKKKRESFFEDLFDF